MKLHLAASTALALCAISCGAAYAQTAQLEEVVITAQRVEENLQRAAIAVSAVTGEQLQNSGISRAEDLTKLTPALNISPSGGPYNLFFLRGVGNFGNNAFADATVAFNYDGVYLSRPGSTNGMLYDLERVEVLKGPQGILYGRNATGGAVNVLPRKPTYEYGGEATVEVGNYDRLLASGAANIPLVEDKVAMRAAFQAVQHDGYNADGTDDQDDISARLQLRLDPTDNLHINLSADYYHQGGKGSSSVPLALMSQRGGPHSAAAIAYYRSFGQQEVGSSPLTGETFRERADNTWWGAHAQVDWETPIGTLTVVPAYRTTDQDYVSTTPGFPIITRENVNQTSFEARLASNNEHALRYVVGAFTFDEDIDTNQLYNQQDNSTNQIVQLNTKSSAVFGQLTWALTDSFRLSAGARYTKEEKTMVGRAVTVIQNGVFRAPAGATTGPFVLYTPAADEWSNTSWKIGSEWDVRPGSLLYASVATGFKAGGFFSAAPPLNVYQPEELTAYTIGSKNRFLDNRLQLNAEVFYWKYQDQQVSHFGVRPTDGALYFPTENIGESTLKGVEVEAQFLATENTLLTANVQYLDAVYDSFSYIQVIPGGPVDAAARIGCPYTRQGLSVAYNVNCSGFPAVNAPDWTINLGIQQTMPLSNGARLVGELRGRYEGERYTQFEYLRDELAPANTTADATLAYHAPENTWSIAAWVNNITDEDVISRAGLYSRRNFTTVSLRPPRTFGVRVNAKF